ncbi:MAG: class II aldolase/adducin family protein [Chloroflexi bacterium]|nr:class II aldolase/adducin family protein [Chloroflexota bacterium]
MTLSSQPVWEDALRAELTRISHRTYNRGLVRGSGGNISARFDDRTMLVTPSGVTLGDTSPENIVKASLTSDEWVPNDPFIPSKEYRFHAAIYQARPDVNAIVHCHPPHATAYAVRKLDIPKVTDAAFKQPAMLHVPFAPSGSTQLVENVAAAVAGQTAFKVILLDEHGIVSVGKDLLTAFIWADLAEEMAQIAFISSQINLPG